MKFAAMPNSLTENEYEKINYFVVGNVVFKRFRK